MKTKMKIIAVVAVMIAATGTMFAQVSATGDATANILAALGVVNNSDLNWGDITPDGTSATVVSMSADASGTRTDDGGGAIMLSSDEGSSAEFELSGEAAETVDLSFTSSSISLSNGTDNMAAELYFTGGLGTTTSSETLTGGNATFYVGGDLTVGAGQASGAYTTTFEVNAQYQ